MPWNMASDMCLQFATHPIVFKARKKVVKRVVQILGRVVRS